MTKQERFINAIQLGASVITTKSSKGTQLNSLRQSLELLHFAHHVSQQLPDTKESPESLAHRYLLHELKGEGDAKPWMIVDQEETWITPEPGPNGFDVLTD